MAVTIYRLRKSLGDGSWGYKIGPTLDFKPSHFSPHHLMPSQLNWLKFIFSSAKLSFPQGHSQIWTLATKAARPINLFCLWNSSSSRIHLSSSISWIQRSIVSPIPSPFWVWYQALLILSAEMWIWLLRPGCLQRCLTHSPIGLIDIHS